MRHKIWSNREFFFKKKLLRTKQGLSDLKVYNVARLPTKQNYSAGLARPGGIGVRQSRPYHAKTRRIWVALAGSPARPATQVPQATGHSPFPHAEPSAAHSFYRSTSRRLRALARRPMPLLLRGASLLRLYQYGAHPPPTLSCPLLSYGAFSTFESVHPIWSALLRRFDSSPSKGPQWGGRAHRGFGRELLLRAFNCQQRRWCGLCNLSKNGWGTYVTSAGALKAFSLRKEWLL